MSTCKYAFRYGYWKRATVTVRANSVEQALDKARGELDRRYEARDEEPPVAWTLQLESFPITEKALE